MDTINGLSLALGKYEKRVEARLKLMGNKSFAKRFWEKDSTLFGKERISGNIPMGWLELPSKMLNALPEINAFCKEIRTSGFTDVVLLGMGGSSLAPLVFQKTFGHLPNGLKLTVLDTTEPETVKKVENSINLSQTLFIVASKSGSTAEVTAFYEYFYYRVAAGKRDKAGENFIAITDEGSPLAQLAAKRKFRKTFINFSDVGGRFSALSYFGIVPAALAGINVRELLTRAMKMADSCGPEIPLSKNPGIMLGTAIAEMTLTGCDKLTYILPEEIDSFGLWMEQLIAESTGKEEKGVLPFNGSPLCGTNCYGKDRFFVKIGFAGEYNDEQSMLPQDLISLKYPMINILLQDELDLGKEFFKWEIATATIGAILGINPFDQPNVQESKKNTDGILKKVEKNGELPRMEPSLTEDSLIYYGSTKSDNGKSLIENLINSVKEGYVVLQAYLPEEPAVQKRLNEMQKIIQKNLKIPVSVQFGPRYLHSTGQFHKGGPNTGCFIQFVSNSLVDINIPEHKYTFGMLKRAQAIGDMKALQKHKRKVVLIDLNDDYLNGLDVFRKVIETLQPATDKSVEPEKIQVKNKKKVIFSKENKQVPEAIVLLQSSSEIKGRKRGRPKK
jgi:glucose-6-phosphate isomerase